MTAPVTESGLFTPAHDDGGFSLVEFLFASLIMLIFTSAALGILVDVHHAVSRQASRQEVLENTRASLETVARHIRQAANDPLGAGFDGITVVSDTEIRLRSDVTGSAGPDTGDPDGDTDDANEDVRIRYNAANRTIELLSGQGSMQPIATNISAFNLQCLDARGVQTWAGGEVRKIRISVAGTSSEPDPATNSPFAMQIACDVRVATRR